MTRIEIIRRDDPRGRIVKEEFQAFGLKKIAAVHVRDVYYFQPELSPAAARRIAERLLCDPVVEKYRLGPPRGFEVLYNPGVTDPREESILKAVADLGLHVQTVQTAVNYCFHGPYPADKIKKLAALFLYNPLIQHIKYGAESPVLNEQSPVMVRTIPLTGDLKHLSEELGLSLSVLEMKTIKQHFDRRGRPPTDVELETIAQTWSEHCRHKTFLGRIVFEGKIIDNLLRSTIMKATRTINHPRCLSVFHDNSGVIDFDDKYGVCFKVETHNHPSALEPYGGAATGIGGVIRDIMGTGLGAIPVMNTDVFCFGPPRLPRRKLPAGLLHPDRIIKGVIRGIRDYGNRMGIPTASGAVYYDQDFLYNPLIFCGCVGLIRKDRIRKKARPGDIILLVGGRTGRDGIHGATFSSTELSRHAQKSCVQIGNPIMEKRVLDCLRKVSDLGLLNSVTDCGGGGLSSAIGEMAKKTGARVDLERVPLKYQGLTPREIWISESQERMILAVPGQYRQRVIRIFKDENVEAVAIGVFTRDRRLRLFYHRRLVADLNMDFLHDGLPMPEKPAVRRHQASKPVVCPQPRDLDSILLELVGGLNSRSREVIIREYDHEVQGASAVKSLVGYKLHGPQDAVVIKPRLDSNRGVIVSCGINPGYGRLDPYRMALAVVDEALRNLVATGGDIKQTALLDNFCFASPEQPEVLGDIVQASRGAHDAAVAFGTPFISGKDSLYNEWTDEQGMRHPIPPTLLISAIGVVNDIHDCVTMDLKQAGNDIYLIGITRGELGGSEYYRLLGIKGGVVPSVDLRTAPRIMQNLHEAIRAGLIRSCHDLSEAGLGLAASEMALAGNIGLEINLDMVQYQGPDRRPDYLLFSESPTRFLIEVAPRDTAAVRRHLKNIPLRRIGQTVNNKKLTISGRGLKSISLSLAKLRGRFLKS